MTGFFKSTFLSLLAISLILGLVYFVTKNVSLGTKKASAIFGTVLKTDLVQKISFAGVVTSQRRSIIAAPYSGYVKKIYVAVGKRVKKGEPLVSVTASLDSFEEVHPLRAPFSGLITLIRKSEGEFVKENDAMDYILRIDDMSKFFIEAKVPEIDRTKVLVGQEAVIKTSAISDLPFKGIVKRVALAPEEKQQGFSFGGKEQVEYPLTIELLDSDERIKPGMSATIDVIAISLKDVLTLRHEYVQNDNDHFSVILEDGTKREIKIGLRNDEMVEIVDGLREGDVVQQVEFAP